MEDTPKFLDVVFCLRSSRLVIFLSGYLVAATRNFTDYLSQRRSLIDRESSGESPKKYRLW